ncbi:HNH endonuclease [Aliarcobacter lanthieri]|uniref:HNH endonuclease n=1 Tax=Aliarcobacter lanthieri TaxID=1355374 RepID=UPI003AB08D19
MPVINKTKLCNKHSFYNAIENPNGCPLCKKENDKIYDSELRAKDRKKIYNSKNWKDIRKKALLRDDYMCVICKSKGIETIATEVDHIIELKENISKAYDLNNLQSLCHGCHMEKTQKEKLKRTF